MNNSRNDEQPPDVALTDETTGKKDPRWRTESFKGIPRSYNAPSSPIPHLVSFIKRLPYSAEIDKVLKQVALGVESFEEVFEKVQQAVASGNSTQRDKLEADLKKEIKKLQRSRDQIKAWISSSEVKDKKPLTDNRRLIETQMEKFKACEKELKTKAFSKEGLSAVTKMDPLERARIELADDLRIKIETLETQIDAFEFEIEKIKNGMGKKKDAAKTEKVAKLEHSRERHKHHIKMLEIVLRMLENGDIEMDPVKALKEDIAYYVDSNQEPDFEEDIGIYDDLDLNDAEAYGINAEDAESENSDNDLPKPKEVKVAEDPKKKEAHAPSPSKSAGIKVVPAKPPSKEDSKPGAKVAPAKPTPPVRTGSTVNTDSSSVVTPIIAQSTIRYAAAAASHTSPGPGSNIQGPVSAPPAPATPIVASAVAVKKSDIPAAVLIAAAAQQSALQNTIRNQQGIEPPTSTSNTQQSSTIAVAPSVAKTPVAPAVLT
ncbi:hypothetical protein HDU84_001169 [Entophlyctis sp. JEL0112]|nr:hypothetical protein HDU84_001169 [Entophlyctis sp. JEL0112]